MKLQLTIEVDVSTEGLAHYYAEYPGFVEFGLPTDVEETLFREAVTTWDYEGLLTSGVEPRLVEKAPVEARS